MGCCHNNPRPCLFPTGACLLQQVGHGEVCFDGPITFLHPCHSPTPCIFPPRACLPWWVGPRGEGSWQGVLLWVPTTFSTRRTWQVAVKTTLSDSSLHSPMPCSRRVDSGEKIYCGGVVCSSPNCLACREALLSACWGL